jgi:agmatinase
MRLQAPSVRFLGSRETDAPAAVILGAPLDLTESFRSGTAAAPDRIRAVSDVLETYSPALDADLEEIALADWGNVEIGDDMTSALAAIADAVGRAAQVALPIVLGGEHTITVGALRGLRNLYPGLTVIQLDAHTDLRDTYEGAQFSHATVMRRLADDIGLSRIAQYGIRSGTREEFALARQCLHSGPDLTIARTVRDRIHTRPVYLTIDIDVLDPSSAPGTGCPEPGGATFSDVVRFLYDLRGLHVVAVDVTEVLPAADVNDITSVAAAKLVREAALLFGKSNRAES